MSQPIAVVCGFLGGTILSVQGGYRVLEHPRPDKVFPRISEARWFLAVRWCDRLAEPAAILTHDGQFSFQNQAVLYDAADFLLPIERTEIFQYSSQLNLGESATYTVTVTGDRPALQVQLMPLEIDPRYGRVTLVWQMTQTAAIA
ncbi:hypothetical protein Lepto7376_0099 [[Leptolyngbya] sp. PCC 7376]|uniref:hypothetical protein n=1 Tax=[Leptolyngbya] sp. PCC 7376 TaxID=111781 RepID=UPI00029F4A05|nr:hypothetical protein [[Leptolyngbya] sp. PCC 7376]AFY36549.1 hypothetical protein Lepto7376_0099 [[Leptolyngbya] sp. PCC 7376]